MKIRVRNMNDEIVSAIEYTGVEVVNSEGYKTFSVLVDGEEIAVYNRMEGMCFDIIREEVDDLEEIKKEVEEMNNYLVTVTYNSGYWTSELESYMSVIEESMKAAKEYAASKVRAKGYHVVKTSAHKVKPGEYVEDYWYRWLYDELVYGEV